MADLTASNRAGKPTVPGRLVPSARHRHGEIRHRRDPAEQARREISEKPSCACRSEELKCEQKTGHCRALGGGLLDEMGAPVLDDLADMEDQEAGAAVIAETEDLCGQARAVLKAGWGVLAHILDPCEGRKPQVPAVQPGNLTNAVVANRSAGDVKPGFKQAGVAWRHDGPFP